MQCYCDSLKTFDQCCEPLLLGKSKALNALELMRSRYSAYVVRNGNYLYDTCSKRLKNIEEIESINTQKVHWLSLKVESFSDNEVIFIAYYKENNEILLLKEQSSFIVENMMIVYDSGKMLSAQINRNELCPCTSGKKYKRCCG